MSQSLKSLLSGSAALRPLLAHVQQLNQWQARYLEFAPPSLARSSRVGQVEQGHLILLADNGAVAAKLRQMLPTLLEEFQRRSCPIREIWVRVEVTARVVRRPSAHLLSPPARQAVGELAGTLADSPLKNALERLLQRGG